MSTYLGATLYNDLREIEAFEAYASAFDLAARSGKAELQHHVRTGQFSIHVAKRDIPKALECLASIDEAALDATSKRYVRISYR